MVSYIQTPVEAERRRRILVAVWAYAYEIAAVPLVPDTEYDREAKLVDLTIDTGRLDDWYRKHFDPNTGLWIHAHPELDGIRRIYSFLKAGGCRAQD